MAEGDDWQRPVFTDEEWRRLALERHEHDVLQGFEGTADERRRELERHFFNDEDVADLSGEYEASWQQIELNQEERQRQARVGSTLSKFERRFKTIRDKKDSAKKASVFDDEEECDFVSANVSSIGVDGLLVGDDETELLSELEAFCVEAWGFDRAVLEAAIILPQGLSTYGRIERMMTAVKERLARTSDGDFGEGELAAHSVGKLEAERIANLTERQRTEERGDICSICQSRVAFPCHAFQCKCVSLLHEECVAKLRSPLCPTCCSAEIDDDVFCGIAWRRIRVELEMAGLVSLLDRFPHEIWSVVAGRMYVFKRIELEYCYSKEYTRAATYESGMTQKVKVLFSEWGEEEEDILRVYFSREGIEPIGRISVVLREKLK